MQVELFADEEAVDALEIAVAVNAVILGSSVFVVYV